MNGREVTPPPMRETPTESLLEGYSSKHFVACSYDKSVPLWNAGKYLSFSLREMCGSCYLSLVKDRPSNLILLTFHTGELICTCLRHVKQHCHIVRT